MMTENNSECFSSLFGDDDKLGLLEREQLKRIRQRVDAGEPRNSYSSIPNFSSRSSLMSSGLYGAIFSQQSQNSFGGLFPANYAPAKMLNELLGRQVKQAQDASNPTSNDGILNQVESASNINNNNNNNNSVKMEFDGSVGSTQAGNNSDGGAQSPPTSANDLAHHMLRNILQGKKDLMTLDQELSRQTGGAGGVGGDRHSPDSNQNTILSKTSNMLNNNNLISNNNNYDVTKSDNVNGSSDSDQTSDVITNNNLKVSSEKENIRKQINGGEHSEANGSSDGKKGDVSEINDDDRMMSDGSVSMPSPWASPSSENNLKMKEELIDGDNEKDLSLCRSPSPSLSASNKSDQGAVMDLKRARVENIVSTIHSSPALGTQTSIQQPQVNGCKKRKLYHPQQHDNSAVERYAAGLSMGLNLHNLMLNDEDDDDEDDEMEPNIHQKRTEKNVLKSQLRSMQEQLAEMQQKYVQLCNRMEQHSETTEDVNDATSDLVDDDLMRDEKRSPLMGSVQQQRTPNASPIKEMAGKSSQVSHAQSMLNQMMSKMMTAKLHHPTMPFNGTHPLLQHMQHQQQQPNADHVQHPAFSNAAAMFLSQKLMMEQEARLAKEAEERNQQHQLQQIQQQQQQAQQQQQHQQQMQKQQEKVQQEMMAVAREQQAQSMHQMHQQNHQQTPNNIPPMKTSPQQQNQPSLGGKSSNVPSELSERLSLMRANVAMQSVNSIGPVSGSDLEGLADILKSEINSSLSSLVDTIVSRFLHQRRMMGKQSEVAAQAAAELNKDLMMASQILDRKSPRTKSSGNDRVPSSNGGNNGSSGNGSNQTGNGSNNSTTNSSNNNTNNNHHLAPSNAMNPIQHHLAQHHQSMITQQMTSNGNSNNNNNNINNNSNVNGNNNPTSNGQQQAMSRGPPSFPPLGQHMAAGQPPQPMVSNGLSDPNSLNSLTQMQSQMNQMNLPTHVRPSPTAGMFQAPSKTSSGSSQINSVAAAALYNSISALNSGSSSGNPFCMPEPPRENTNEQNEALSLVVTPKKKRHKVTDTRITPRTVSRILAQDALAAAQQNHLESQRQEHQNQQNQNQIQQQQQSNGQNVNQSNLQNGGSIGNKSFGSNGVLPSRIPNEQASPRANYHHSAPPTMLPVSLPTSVAIPNPSLHESQVFSPYSPFFNPHGPHGPQTSSLHHMHMSSSPPGIGALMDPRDSPPLPHPPTMLHPALLAAAHHGASPDYGHIRAAMDANDRNSDCNSADISYDGMQSSISFSNAFLKQLNHKRENNDQNQDQFSLNNSHSATLTPMHLRKAKLMFFWVRYPSSAVLKMYFPDIKFNKNNTAQLVKWFSNFREFYYIQMEKYARQAVSEGVKCVDDIHISMDSEIYRVLNLHYNRNNHIEVPPNFRFVVEQTLREFFRAIQGGKDQEQSWKKAIYKVISRMDDPVPEYFKSPNFLEQLE
ncbi:CLUMA_CG003665, isoform B [Clunio marinus]|uniref:Homeobox protein prospero n=1 Tax=Clunio marinus TaxID=568069 RepID=A0A1J1HPF7_9DIPT|nr:CLUMA_CG003665, isoform B [Clunio marinus]